MGSEMCIRDSVYPDVVQWSRTGLSAVCGVSGPRVHGHTPTHKLYSYCPERLSTSVKEMNIENTIRVVALNKEKKILSFQIFRSRNENHGLRHGDFVCYHDRNSGLTKNWDSDPRCSALQ